MRRPSVRAVALSVAMVLVAAACSSGDDTGTSGRDDGAVSSDTTEDDGAIGEPVPVTMVPDTATAITQTVGREGAILGATGSDGTEYALRIPAGALPEGVEITMTPLAGLSGLPGDAELAFGVQLQPSGLVFAVPGWLYVASDADPDEVTGLGIHDDLATLAGIGFDGDRFVLPVAHFSGNGACFPRCGGPGWPGGRPGGSPPGSPGSPGGSPITPPGPDVPPYEPPGTPPGPFPPGDDGATGGGEPDRGSLTDGESGAPAGGDTDAAVADAVQDLADAQLTGDEEAERAANEKLDDVKERVKDEAWKAAEACVEEKDLDKLKEILHWVTVAQLLGAAKDDAEDEKLLSLIAVCYRFELVTQADLTAKFGGDTFVIGDSIELTVPLLFDGARLAGEATGPVDPTGYDRGAEILELLGVGLGALAGVDVPNDLSQNDFFDCSTTPGTGRLAVTADNLLGDSGPLVIVMPSIASDASVTCPDPINTFPMPPFVPDLTYYTEAAFPGAGDAGLYFDGWTVTRGGRPFATKTVSHVLNEEGGEIRFAWDLAINHVPGPMPPR